MVRPTRRSCRRTSCAPSRQPRALSAGSRAAAARAFSAAAVLLNLAAAAQDGFAAKRDSKSGSGLGLMLAATTYMYDVEADGGSLCLWIQCMVEYYDIIQIVEPKRAALHKARTRWELDTARLEEERAKLEAMQAHLEKVSTRTTQITHMRTQSQARARTCLTRLAICVLRFGERPRRPR